VASNRYGDAMRFDQWINVLRDELSELLDQVAAEVLAVGTASLVVRRISVDLRLTHDSPGGAELLITTGRCWSGEEFSSQTLVAGDADVRSVIVDRLLVDLAHCFASE